MFARSQRIVRPEPTDCSPRANGLFAPSQRIVRPEPTDCSPSTQRIVRPGPADCSPRPAGRPDNPPASQAKSFGKKEGEFAAQVQKVEPPQIRTLAPTIFFWKWEGYFAAQEQKVELHGFYQICLNFVSENRPRNAIYIRFVQSGAQKECGTSRIAYECTSVSVSRFFITILDES